MKLSLSLALTALLLAATLPNDSWAFGPDFGPRYERGRSARSFEAASEFNTFLHSHPGISKDLSANPNLANDGGYLRRHEPLKKFLDRYPQVRAELARNPGRFLARTYNSGYRR